MRSISTRPISKNLLSISTAWISPAVCTGEGEGQLKDAMSQILVQENAKKNLLQASSGEVNIAILFNEGVITTLQGRR